MTRVLGIVCALFAFCAAEARAQLAPITEGGARAIALGRAGTALEGDVWGIFNPGSWASIEEGRAALFASQAFGMSELRTGSVALAYPTSLGVVAGSARTYGFEDFRENVFGIGFARAIPVSPTRRLLAGVAMRYTGVSIPEFGSTGAFGLSLGVLTEIIPGLTFGAHALNLNRPELSPSDPLETRLDAGLAYRAHPQALVVLAASKDLDFPLSLRGGLEVQPVEVLFVRAGFSTEPTRFSTGIGVAIGPLRGDVAADHHEALGWSPAFEIGFRW